MFGHISIHKPRPGKAEDLTASMRRFRAAALGQPGLVECAVFRDAKTGWLVGLALWRSRAAWEKAVPAVRAAVENDPFDEWEEEDPQVFFMDEA